MKFILTSTTGNLGSRVLSHILKHKLIPSSDIVISSSSGKTSAEVAASGIEVRKGDYTSSSSLTSSFKGGDVLFLVSYPSPSIERYEYHKVAIDAAVEAGVKVVIYTSLMFGGETGLESTAGVQQAHIKTVRYLEEVKVRFASQSNGLQGGSGEKEFDFIVVREGIYAESWWLYAGWQPADGYPNNEKDDIEWIIPDDGPIAWVGWDDLAAGTAWVLKNYEEYIGQTLRLTGPRATTMHEVARLVERETGRRVIIKLIGKNEAIRHHKEEKKSDPEDQHWYVNSWGGWFEGIKNGETAVVDPFLEKLLGRSPLGIEELSKSLFRQSQA